MKPQYTQPPDSARIGLAPETQTNTKAPRGSGLSCLKALMQMLTWMMMQIKFALWPTGRTGHQTSPTMDWP